MSRYRLLVLILAVLIPSIVLYADPPDNFLTNGSFESGFTGWTVANKSGDKIICNGTPAAINGVCVLKIKGGDPEFTLTQSASAGDIAELNAVLACTAVNIRPSYPFMRTSDTTKWSQVTLTLKYTWDYYDYTLKAKLKPAVSNVIGWAVPFNPGIPLRKFTVVSSMKLQLRDKNASGVMYADNLRIGWELGSAEVC